jgi:hypothetical protein
VFHVLQLLDDLKNYLNFSGSRAPLPKGSRSFRGLWGAQLDEPAACCKGIWLSQAGPCKQKSVEKLVSEEGAETPDRN